jgi:hypothetical protein
MAISAAEYQAITRNDFCTFVERSFRELKPVRDDKNIKLTTTYL